MKDEDKTKEQLLAELVELRRQVAELKAPRVVFRREEAKPPVQIGEILVEAGWMTRSQLEKCLRAQQEVKALGHGHKPLGEIALESVFITREQLRKGLEVQLTRLRHRLGLK